MLHTAHLRLIQLLLLLALLVVPSLGQEEGKRYALIIGNNSYSVSPLQNAVNDARVMEKALKDADFEIIKVENSSLAMLRLSMAQWLKRIGPADTALFFYAGHGIQIETANFLVPTDFEAPDNMFEVRARLFPVNELFDGLRSARAKRAIVILDACRSNPIAKQNALEVGLAQPQNTPNETYVVFSTSPGQTAADNPTGHNSYFTESLAIEVQKPGLTIEDALNHVKAQVYKDTEGKQQPGVFSNLKLTFYFHPPLNREAESAVSMSVKWMADAKRFEQHEEWDEAIARVEQVLQSKAGGGLQADAESRRSYLLARREAQTAYDKNDYAAAASGYEKAFQLNKFAMDAAFEGVFSYLELEQIDPAVRLLHAIRVQGTTDDTEKAMRMLEALKAVNQPAAIEASAKALAPPSIDEVFSGTRFGTPDWEAGKRVLVNSPVDPSHVLSELEAKIPAPTQTLETSAAQGSTQPQAANTNTAIAEALKVIYHAELEPNKETRDMRIKRSAAGTLNENEGFVQFDDPGIPLVFDNKIQHLPGSLPMQAGAYEIKFILNGKQVCSPVEFTVLAGAVQKVSIQRCTP